LQLAKACLFRILRQPWCYIGLHYQAIATRSWRWKVPRKAILSCAFEHLRHALDALKMATHNANQLEAMAQSSFSRAFKRFILLFPAFLPSVLSVGLNAHACDVAVS
jgi:hypothetical protein